MANSPVANFTNDATPIGTDIMYTVKSPFAAGDDRKVTLTNLFGNSRAIAFPASAAVAITAASYQITRDADATNQLHFNVPTGATFEWSVNDVAKMTLSDVGALVITGAATIGTGSTTINGRTHIGGITDAGAVSLLVTGSAGSGAGGIQAFRLDAGAHTNNANAAFNDVYFDLSRTVEFAGGGADIEMTNFIIDSPAYTALAAQTLDVACTFNVSGPPIAGANISIRNSVIQYIGNFNSDTLHYGNDFGGNLVIAPGGIGNGIGAVSTITSLGFVGSNNVTLGNQTATLDTWDFIHATAVQLRSTALTRTVTNPNGFYVEAPTAGANVIFTNPANAIYAKGSLKVTNGNIVLGTTAAGSTAANVFALSNSATAPTTSVDLAQLFGKDIAAGRATLAMVTEEPVNADVGLATTHSGIIWWNGSKYKVGLTFVA